MSSSSRVRGTRRGAGSATCSRWRTSSGRSSSSGSLTWRCTWHSASSRTCAKIRQQRRQHQGQAHEVAPGQRARGRRQGGPAARPGHPVLTGALHCCSRASPSTSNPTFNCPLPRLRRPPADLNAATTDNDCDPSGAAAAPRPTDYGARARQPQRGQHQQGLRTERRAARRPTDYGARARAGGTCLVAVLHAASVIGCWRRAAAAASLWTAPDARCTPPTHLMMLAASRTSSTRHRHSYQRTIMLAAPAARPQHPMTLAACNTATRHVPPALALAPYDLLKLPPFSCFFLFIYFVWVNLL